MEPHEEGKVRFTGVIAVEGRATPDGRLIEPGALSWDKKPTIAVVDAGNALIGAITSIERVEEVIRVEGYFHGTPPSDRGASMAIDKQVMRPKTHVFTSAVIRAMYLIPEDQTVWPEARITIVE